MRLRGWMATAVAVNLAACGGQPVWEGSIVDSAGVTIVTNTDMPLWSEGEQWTLVEELRIGSIEGDPDFQFGQVGWIAVGRDKSVYVLDTQAQDVKHYSSDGAFLGRFGGPGGGPGEIGTGAGLGSVFILMAEGDTLLVPDAANQRVNMYSADGESLGSFPLTFADGLTLAWRGTATGAIARQVRPLQLPNQPAVDSMDFVVVHYADGTVRDTIMRFPSGGSFSFAP